MVTQNYRNAYKEVYIILQCLKDEEYQKIPQDVIDAIEENMNDEYLYEMDEDENLANQPMLLETRATLFNLFRDYLSTPEQRNKIIRMQSEDRLKDEIQKQERYNVDNLFANMQRNQVYEQKEEPETDIKGKELVIVEKKNIFKQILTKIKNLFARH